MRLLVTGAGGLLGSAVAAEATRRDFELFAFTRQDLDVTNARAVRSAVRSAVSTASHSAHSSAARAALPSANSTVIVNCAAFSQVDRAETRFREALEVNRDGALNVAEAAGEVGALMVHISTDYVFDGTKREPYRPTDQPAPLNRYGTSKLAGEMAVRESGAPYLILRTSWLFGEGRPGFVTFLRDAMGAGAGAESLRVVDDQWSRPSWTGELAPAVLELAAKGAHGCLHLANRGSCSRLELALEVKAVMGGERSIRAVSSEEFGAPAQRPAYSVLDLTDAERILGRSLSPWQEALRRFLRP